MKKLLLIILLLASSAVASFWGLGYSYRSQIIPGQDFPDWHGIYGDGWVQDGAWWRIHDLAQRGNRLKLKFDHWRTAGIKPAQIRITLCGERVAEFVVSQRLTVPISLKGSCQPKMLQFEVVNPFVPHQGDRRRLGARLVEAEISSRLAVPIVAPALLLTAFGMFAVFGLIILVTKAGRFYHSLAFLGIVAGSVLTGQASGLELTKVFSVWLFFSCCALGALLASHIDFKRLARSSKAMLPERHHGWPVILLLFLVIIGGAALRLYGLRFGLPDNFHPDEVPKVNAIERMITYGDFNPRYFLHPSLLLYSTYFVSIFVDWFGVYGTWRENAFLAGRIVSLIAGTASIGLVYLIGRRLYSAGVGLMAAAFLAVFPLHVTCSRYLKEDALLLLMVLLCVWALLKAVYEDRVVFLLLAGVFAGFACGVKYTGLLTFGIIGLAPWLKSRTLVPDPRFMLWGIVAACLVPLAFLLTTPYALLDSAAFLRDFESERKHAARGHTTPVTPWSKYWTYHLYYSIMPGIGLFVTVLSMIAIGLFIWRRKVEDLLVIALVVLFYLPAEGINSKPAPQPERYIFCILPFLALAAGELLRTLYSWRLPLLAALLFFTALVMPLTRTVQLASEIKDDTRKQMGRWIEENLPHGSRIYLDWKRYAPSVSEEQFELTFIPRAKIIKKLELNDLRNSGRDYLVLSSLFYDRYFSHRASPPAIRQLFRQIFSVFPILKEIAPKHGTYGFHNPTLTLFSLREEDRAVLEEELRLKQQGQLEQTSNERISSFFLR